MPSDAWEVTSGSRKRCSWEQQAAFGREKMTTHSTLLLDKRVGRHSHWDRTETKQWGGEVSAGMPWEEAWGAWAGGKQRCQEVGSCEVRGVEGSAGRPEHLVGTSHVPWRLLSRTALQRGSQRPAATVTQVLHEEDAHVDSNMWPRARLPLPVWSLRG